MKTRLIKQLYDSKCIEFGKFKLKSGQIADVYINLRRSYGNSTIMNEIAAIAQNSSLIPAETDAICSIAIGGIDIANHIASLTKLPRILVDLKKKEYGSLTQIHGDYKPGAKVMLVDDVMTSGGSFIEAAQILMDNGLEVLGAICVVSRKNNDCGLNLRVSKVEIPVHAICSLNDILRYRYDQSLTRNVLNYGLCIAADSNLKLAFECAAQHENAAIKVHSDIIPELQRNPAPLAHSPFLLIEDRKFVDIGQITKQQYLCGHMDEYADAVTVLYTMGAESTISGLISANTKIEILLVTELTTGPGAKSANPAIKQLVAEFPQIVGLITPFPHLYKDLGVMLLTTGVSLKNTTDALGQQYITPEEAVARGTNAIIVGRGILDAACPHSETKKYMDAIKWKESML